MNFELNMTFADLLLLLPEIFLTLWLCLVLIVDFAFPRLPKEQLAYLSVVGLVVTLGCLAWFDLTHISGALFGNMFVLDRMAIFFKMFIVGASIFAATIVGSIARPLPAGAVAIGRCGRLPSEIRSATAQARKPPNSSTSASMPLASRCATAQVFTPSTIGWPTARLMRVPGTYAAASRMKAGIVNSAATCFVQQPVDGFLEAVYGLFVVAAAHAEVAAQVRQVAREVVPARRPPVALLVQPAHHERGQRVGHAAAREERRDHRRVAPPTHPTR